MPDRFLTTCRVRQARLATLEHVITDTAELAQLRELPARDRVEVTCHSHAVAIVTFEGDDGQAKLAWIDPALTAAPNLGDQLVDAVVTFVRLMATARESGVTERGRPEPVE